MRDLGVIFTDRDGRTFTALKSVSVDIDRGEFIAVIGLSGAGKSTFLRCLNRMNEPTSGTVLFEGRDVTHVTGRALTELRRQIGFIFQQFNLVRSLPVLQNVLSGRLAYAPGLRSFFGSFAQKDVDLARHYLSEVILQLLRKFNRDEGITVIVNLHVLELARRYADRIIAFRAGEIHFDGPPDALTPEIVEEVYRTSREQMEKL